MCVRHINDSQLQYVARISHGKDSLKMLDEPLSTEQYAIGFKLGNEELRDEVWEAVLKLVEDGTFMELAEKYELGDMVCIGK